MVVYVTWVRHPFSHIISSIHVGEPRHSKNCEAVTNFVLITQQTNIHYCYENTNQTLVLLPICLPSILLEDIFLSSILINYICISNFYIVNFLDYTIN